MRVLLVCLCLIAVAAPQDRKAVRYAQRAKKTADSVKEVWKRFVFEPNGVTDDEVKSLIKTYDKAVGLYQESQEVEETAAVNSAILLLTRKATQARFALMARLMRRKQAATPKPPRPPPKPPPGGKAPPPVEEEEEEAEEEPEPPPPPEIVRKDGLPTLDEPKDQKRRGTQALRNFLMNHYLPSRKFAKLVSRCPICNGSGRRKTNYLDENRRIITKACKSCHETGYHLNESVARKGFWLLYSPLYRSDDANRQSFESRLDAWRNDPRKLPEFLSRLKILYIDYYGLWAEVTWKERGRTPDKRMFERTVRRKLLRAGKRWYFYEDRFDRGFFDSGEEDG